MLASLEDRYLQLKILLCRENIYRVLHLHTHTYVEAWVLEAETIELSFLTVPSLNSSGKLPPLIIIALAPWDDCEGEEVRGW